MGAMLDHDGKPQNPDQWDGYQASRNRLFDFLERERIGNLVVLTRRCPTRSWGNGPPAKPARGLRPRHRGRFPTAWTS